jgi:hypothetical protein
VAKWKVKGALDQARGDGEQTGEGALLLGSRRGTGYRGPIQALTQARNTLNYALRLDPLYFGIGQSWLSGPQTGDARFGADSRDR